MSRSNEHRPLLGLMLGDPTGIGPEQCARALADGRLNDAARIVVVGDRRVIALGELDAGVELRCRSDASTSAIDATMRAAGFATPRIAVAALNPHGGENGLFGRDEIEVIAPAAASEIACKGPFPADTVFLKALAGEFDGVPTMYHDQGQIATKLQGFNRGVTVTAGLETVFTTPAHGTAFDIAGQGKASADALEQAVRLGARLAAGRVRAKTAELAAVTS